MTDFLVSFQAHEVPLRDGRTVRLRLAEPGDGARFLEFYAGLSAQSRDFMHGWSTVEPRAHAESLALKTRSSDHCAIAAIGTGDRIVGYGWLDGLRTANKPMLGIGIIDEFHEGGLGKALLRTVIGLAGSIGLPHVRLGVWTDNARALHVYRSVGFRDDPTLPAKVFDGRTEFYLAVETGCAGPVPPRQFVLAKLAGTPYEIGRQHGGLFRAQIAKAIQVMGETLSVPPEAAMAYAAKSLPYCREHAPELVEEVLGIANGAGRSLDEIFTLNASLDLILSQARLNRTHGPDCWTMALTRSATADGRTMVTWTAEDSAKWFDSCVLLEIRPTAGLPCLVWTFAGFVGRPGINPHLALAAAARGTDDCGHGLPYPFLCRKALACASTADAVKAITGHERMAGMDYVFGDAQGAIAAWHTTARTSRPEPESAGWVACAGRWAEERLPRLDMLVHQRRNTREDIEAIMRDHGPGNLCPHDKDLASLMTFVADVGDRALWVAHGNACQNEYVRYTL